MKKVLLTLAASALMVGSAWAGTPSVSYGNSPLDFRNESVIVQTGEVSWAKVAQIGDQSYSDIAQSGKHDTAEVKQNSNCCVTGHCGCYGGWMGTPIFTSSTYQNYSKIKQAGTGFHDAYVDQKGDGNWSSIDQSGKDDSARVTQNGGFNTSTVKQAGYGVNNATVTQNGDLNISEITQNNGINTALVDQSGFGNKSLISQGGNFGGFGVNTASVSQVGYNNLSDITQSGCGSHTAIVSQTNTCFTGSVDYCKFTR